MRRRSIDPGILLAGVLVALQAVLSADGAPTARLQGYEAAIAQDPENLVLASDYRQVSIATRQFDRSIDFFEKLAKRKGSGPNVQLSLALALVDKSPTVGEVRRAYVGFDAMSAVTRALARQPSVLAYYIRGRINLGYDKLIFHRTDRGVADLERALSLVTPATSPMLVGRIYLFLGDGYYKLDNSAKAREAWTAGAAVSPDNTELKSRLDAAGTTLRDLVHDSLSPSRRADTSLSVSLLGADR
jgi:tetratricopeptide (TPR) repeat protein